MIEEKFGYTFKNRDLLQKVLLHSSKYRKPRTVSEFERFEFLGDKVLAMVLADILYNMYPKDDEGSLSVRMAYLSGKGYVSTIFEKLCLSEDFDLSNDCSTPAVFTDCVESVIGAIFMDSDYVTVRDIVKRIWGRAINDSLKKDYKTILQEFLQSRGFGLPIYELDRTSGPLNNTTFFVKVSNPKVKYFAMGQGKSKKEAQQDAAKIILEKLKHE